MKSPNTAIVTSILVCAARTESFQISSVKKTSLPVYNFDEKSILKIPATAAHQNSASALYSSSEQKSDIVMETQESKKDSREKEQEEDKNPLEKFIADFMASMPFSGNDEQRDEARIRKGDLLRNLLKRLANLSLQDYYWRSDFFKKTEADRQVEESLARMMGEEAAYVRPMDAADEKMGPLGKAEQQIVKWLSLVIEEEGRRARLISSTDGDLVRPIDLEVGGPLSNLESSAVTLLERIRSSEKERVLTSTLRPKDLDEDVRGPLGNLEAKVVSALDEIKRSERLRMQQSRIRGGEIVRPIDVPGPLGEMELWYLELITAEKQRAKDRINNNGELVRPKDGSIQGPMGEAERQFSEAMNVIKEEETERLKNVKRFMKEKRPMEADRDSAWGWTEAVIVGLFRAPQMLFRVVDRVKELLESEELESSDQNMLRKKGSEKKE